MQKFMRPKVDETTHRQAKAAAALRGEELTDFLSKIIPLGIKALEKQEAETQKQVTVGRAKAIAS